LRDSKVHLRISSRISRLVLWVLLLAGLAASVPLRIAAQDAGKVNKPETAVPLSAAASSEAKPAQSDDEQQNRAFRLEGPVVKWTARTLNLSIEKTADIFEVINFLIIALAIGVPLIRFLPKYLRQRKQKLSDDIESARKVTQDANARLSAVEAKLSSLDAEIQKFRAEVEAESLQDEARIKASLGEESTRIVQAAEQEISIAAAQARRGLRHFAADLAIDQAANHLNLTPEIDRALIAEFVGDVVSSGAAKGGKN
jgi:F-type H+-transporting ATPase subunit b